MVGMSLTPSPPPGPVEPFPIEPSPIDPASVNPRSVDPASADPASVEPGPFHPDPIDPASVRPDLIDPASVDPASVNPGPVHPAPDDPFEVAGVDWQPVMRQLVTVRRLANGLGDGLFVVALGVAAAVWRPWWLFALAGVALALSLWTQWLIPRQVRALAWGLRDRDLVFRQGVKFRQLTYVPFVRVQYVDIKAGPIDRAFGLTTVTVNTAASGLAATIPGLDPETAARLREALTDKSKLEADARPGEIVSGYARGHAGQTSTTAHKSVAETKTPRSAASRTDETELEPGA
jgi:membrane protein YdbS with pleckstrin-like domain